MSLVQGLCTLAYLDLFSTVDDAAAAVTDKLLRVHFVFALPTERIVLIGRVNDVKLDCAAHADTRADELYAASTRVECRARQVRIATSTADVVGVFQLKVAVRHQTSASHADDGLLTSWLQVWNTDNNDTMQQFFFPFMGIHKCCYPAWFVQFKCFTFYCYRCYFII